MYGPYISFIWVLSCVAHHHVEEQSLHILIRALDRTVSAASTHTRVDHVCVRKARSEVVSRESIPKNTFVHVLTWGARHIVDVLKL